MTQALSYLSDLLCIESVTWDIKRNDEISGTGDGRIWQASLAPPLWQATINLNVNYHDEVKNIAARIRNLQGAKEPFLLEDPLSPAPLFDRDGTIASSNTITLASFNSTGYTINFGGFTPNFKLTWGDKFHIRYGVGNDKYSFHEIAGDYTASSTGSFTNVNIFPNLPAGIATGAQMYFYHPSCKMIIFPDTFSPGTASGVFTNGLTFRAIQKK